MSTKLIVNNQFRRNVLKKTTYAENVLYTIKKLLRHFIYFGKVCIFNNLYKHNYIITTKITDSFILMIPNERN